MKRFRDRRLPTVSDLVGLCLILLFIATGCKTAERVKTDTATQTVERRDSVRVVYRDRVVYKTDTVTTREVVKEYGAPVLIRDTVYFTPLKRETLRETETGTREEWLARTDSITQARLDASFDRTDTGRSETEKDNKTGIYVFAVLLVALLVGACFLDKRLDKYM